jgi:hypothetical protein
MQVVGQWHRLGQDQRADPATGQPRTDRGLRDRIGLLHICRRAALPHGAQV